DATSRALPVAVTQLRCPAAAERHPHTNVLLATFIRVRGVVTPWKGREMAAFMASAYAKFTGELGVCIATSGPGASHLITGLYDARLDHMPVLAITGQQARSAMGGHYQQEVDLPSLFKDVAGAFVQ